MPAWEFRAESVERFGAELMKRFGAELMGAVWKGIALAVETSSEIKRLLRAWSAITAKAYNHLMKTELQQL